ncbi:hypothetical protein J2X11_002141 [Aeromicrobium panaciterrae]|uniref:DUF3515 domain-containing protein n=1 Tax=Aeromicrobium panaciterrae TaxID=363861 RepID=A0ABU1UQ52_9ACTN|nr:DUF3515 family protein [Aeromicrobium panaciterrae]MDR7087302.1 hypothetical protein [Aeromicrobium panaciterrae]
MKRLLPALLLLAGCSSGLVVDTYPTTPDTDADCKALYADGVQKVAGQKQVLVKGSKATAWGDPAIILRCGVTKPDELLATSRCDMVADVGWFTEKIADGYLFTTIGRQFFISVEVPAAYDPAADALVDIAPSVLKHDPVVKACV